MLKEQLRPIPQLKNLSRDSAEFAKWQQLTKSVIANVFGQDSPQRRNFDSISYHLSYVSSATPDSAYQRAYVGGLEDGEAQLEALIAEIQNFWPDVEDTAKPDTAEHLLLLFEKFHIVARQLRHRHAGRDTLNVADEYDVQDLLHALLKLYFDDVRAEEWTPSYAGGSSRMDFLLSEHDIVVEVKKTRQSMTAREVGEQLIVDVARYQAHPQLKMLFCFVYDPEGLLPNPAGLERDLSGTRDGIEVKCLIRPK